MSINTPARCANRKAACQASRLDGGPIAAPGERARHPVDGLPLPNRDHRVVSAVLHGQLRQRQVAPDRLQRHLLLEIRAVVLPRRDNSHTNPSGRSGLTPCPENRDHLRVLVLDLEIETISCGPFEDASAKAQRSEIHAVNDVFLVGQVIPPQADIERCPAQVNNLQR